MFYSNSSNTKKKKMHKTFNFKASNRSKSNPKLFLRRDVIFIHNEHYRVYMVK